MADKETAQADCDRFLAMPVLTDRQRIEVAKAHFKCRDIEEPTPSQLAAFLSWPTKRAQDALDEVEAAKHAHATKREREANEVRAKPGT